MKQPRRKIAQTIADKTAKGTSSKKLSQEVAAYLLQERRVGELDSIMRDVQQDWATAGIVEVLATSAYPITASIKTDITKEITQLYPNAKQIIVTEQHDPEVIGGVQLSLANQQLDLSIEGKLNKFKQLMTAGKD